MTKGVVKADKALKSHKSSTANWPEPSSVPWRKRTSGGARRTAPASRSRSPPATLSIRQMRTNVYQVPNTTHWIQTANAQSHCPVFPGDTRITVIEVCDLLPEQEVAKQTCWRS